MDLSSQPVTRQARSFRIDDIDQLSFTYRAAPIEYMQLKPGKLGATIHGVATSRAEVREATFRADLLMTIDSSSRNVFGLGIGITGDVEMLGTRLTSSNVGYTNADSGVVNRLRSGPTWCNLAVDRTLLNTLAHVHHYEMPPGDGSHALPTKAHGSVASLLGRIARGRQLEDLSDSQFDEAVALLTLRILNPGGKRDRVGRASHRRIVGDIIEFIHEAYCSRITMSDVCRLAQVSERSLQYVFRNTTGMSIQQYLKCYRLHRARSLLVNGEVEDVRSAARACGIPHTARFSQYYRDQFGELPRESLAGSS